MSTAAHAMTAEELIKLPRGQHRYELVKGELLTMSPAGEEHGLVSANVLGALWAYVKNRDLGAVYGSETGFLLETAPDTVLAPDVAFIKRERVGKPTKRFRSGAPDLVVEVISPSDSKHKVERKTAQWLQLGALAVWLVDPQSRTVEIRLVDGERKLLTVKDELSGGELIPGFRLAVSEIFTI